MSQKATFKKNGGYFINGVAYMDCKSTGEPVANVSLDAVSVMGSRALHNRCLSLMSKSERDKLFGSNVSTRETKPRGWRWMTEFVTADGTVYHKGVEQPDLKGTRPITDIEALREKRKKNKEAMKVKEQKNLLTHAKKAKEAKTAAEALKKQKDFLNHKKG
tara:strand:- start:1142 stop:1624 length:483 start_codon:yes stop_codon:yes gene_type:complete